MRERARARVERVQTERKSESGPQGQHLVEVPHELDGEERERKEARGRKMREDAGVIGRKKGDSARKREGPEIGSEIGRRRRQRG